VSPVNINRTPLIFIRISEYFANELLFFSVDVNSAKNIIIMHWPNAKKNNKATEKSILFDIVAIAIMLAKIGDEQGLDAKAKNVPIINGKIILLPFLFSGIFFIIVGKFISNIPSKLSPNIIITDAKTRITTGEAKFVKALPVIAHNTPIILSTNDNPSEKDNICINSFLFPSLEYPPTYPIINGRIPKLQGDIEVKIPDRNAKINNIGKTKLLLVKYWENNCTRLSIN